MKSRSWLLVALAPISLSFLAADWPQFRGPQRSGFSAETGLLQEWPKEGPKLLWRAEDVGSGYSTPAVGGERFYLLGNDGLENEFVQAIATGDGKRIWSTRLGNVGKPDQNPSFPGARSTPTVDGALLYALGSDGDLVCAETAAGGHGGSAASFRRASRGLLSGLRAGSTAALRPRCRARPV